MRFNAEKRVIRSITETTTCRLEKRFYGGGVTHQSLVTSHSQSTSSLGSVITFSRSYHILAEPAICFLECPLMI